MVYEEQPICQLHTIYEHPGRFGTKGPFFYKHENHIADLCIVKLHQFWTRRQEKDLHRDAAYARLQAATKPVSDPLRFFDKHGNACVVPTCTTDGLCYTGFNSTPPPEIQLPHSIASQINSKCCTLCNSTNGCNQGNIDHPAQLHPLARPPAQLKDTYEGALQKLVTTNTMPSAPADPYAAIPWSVPPASAASWTLKGDVKTGFAIYSEERRCKLAI